MSDLRQGTIYCITNKVNGKRYIGQTVQGLAIRWKHHRKAARDGSDWALHRAIRNHGPENFKIEIVAETLQAFLNDLESTFVSLYNTHVDTGHGYNMTAGGGQRGGLAEEARLRMSAAAKRPMSEASKQKLRDSHENRSPELKQADAARLTELNRNREYTPAYILKMSKAQMGKTIPIEQRERTAAKNRGRKRTPEQCQTMSVAQFNRDPIAWEKAAESNRGQKRTKEQCQRIGETSKDRPCIPATRAKISASVTAALAANPRDAKQYTVNGVTQTVRGWANDLGCARYALDIRLNRLHWSPEKAFTTPVRPKRANTTRPPDGRDGMCPQLRIGAQFEGRTSKCRV